MRLNIAIILLFLSSVTYGQYSKEKILTDSSEIEIIRNNVYKIYEETFKDKDSIWLCVYYTHDTSIINESGWSRKNRDRIGEWNQFDLDGIWINSINYDNDTWKYNEEKYPYFRVLDSIKLIGDSLIKEKYGELFFKKNIRHQFWGSSAYVVYNKKDSVIRKKYIASSQWNEPIEKKPNEFELQYSIQLDKDHIYDNYGSIIEINLDSLGNQFSDNEYKLCFKDWQKGKNDTFNLTYNKAIDICKANGLIFLDSINYEASFKILTFKKDDYAGNFIFEVIQKIDSKVLEGQCPEKCKYEITYRKWLIDPWTSKLLKTYKYKIRGHWDKGCGGSGNEIRLKN